MQALEQPADVVAPVRRPPPRVLRHFPIPPRVEFHFDAASNRTQLALVCADRPGLLAGVAQVFRAHGARVHDARIATFGERVEDFFLITDEFNRPLPEPAQKELGEALASSVDEAAAAPPEGSYVIA
jgi:[protein-PII] uridylyltransferase